MTVLPVPREHFCYAIDSKLVSDRCGKDAGDTSPPRNLLTGAMCSTEGQ